MKSIVLNKNIGRRVENGHPWIFANEVNRGKALDTAAKKGEIVDVYTHDKKFIGRGYVNPDSKIMVRLLTRDKTERIDDNFFYQKILSAWEYRQKLGYT
jgi:23S rRNA (cytosine1962-C5)-methyltransferase